MRLFFILAGLLLACPALADPGTDTRIGSIRGTVVDKDLDAPVSYATVVLKNPDGSTLMGEITAEDGSFELQRIPVGTYVFEVQYIGYQKYQREVSITRERRVIEMGVVYLEERSEALDEVEVVAERSTIEQRIDRKVINVGKDLTTAGATASEIMNNLPSVNLDQQTGELTLRGNSNVRVMIDGKLSNVPVAQLLRQIPSTSIKSIELITNPSAKYNPEGMSGIINIVLHKNTNIGFNGNLNLGLTKGIEAKFNSSADFNYRRGMVNVYGSYGNNIGRYVNDGFIFRQEENSRQLFDFTNNNKSHLYKAGVDLYLDEHQTFSFFTNQNTFDGKGTGLTRLRYTEAPERDGEQLFRNTNENHSQQYNFDYKVDFEKEGHSLELEVDLNRFEDEEVANFDFRGPQPIPDYQDFVDTRRDQDIVNLDYVNPLDSITKLEAGLELRQFETGVDYRSTGRSFNSSGQLIPTPATAFIYGMDIYSAYATFAKEYEKWSFQGGLRVEDVSVKADTNAVRAFTDDYFEFYPSGFLSYQASEKDQLQVSYSRRIDRPGLGQVNPIREFATPLISAFGNPELRPQFTNSYELNYTRRLEKGSVTTGVFYRTITDEISRAVFIDRLDLNKLILTYANFAATDAYGAELSLNYNLTEWWGINGSADIFSQTQRGATEFLREDDGDFSEADIVLEEVEVQNTAWNLRLNQSFKATKALSFQLFAFYRGENQNLQFLVEPMYFVNAGARYSFAGGDGTVSVNFNDLFNTMRFRFDGQRPYVQNGEFNWESQNLYLGLSYRFGSGKNRSLQRRQRDDRTKGDSGGIL